MTAFSVLLWKQINLYLSLSILNINLTIKFKKSPHLDLKRFLKLSWKDSVTQIESLDVFKNHWKDSNSPEVKPHISKQMWDDLGNI